MASQPERQIPEVFSRGRPSTVAEPNVVEPGVSTIETVARLWAIPKCASASYRVATFLPVGRQGRVPRSQLAFPHPLASDLSHHFRRCPLVGCLETDGAYREARSESHSELAPA